MILATAHCNLCFIRVPQNEKYFLIPAWIKSPNHASNITHTPDQRSLGEEIPGHALHDKGLPRQTGVVTLVSSQERKALAVQLINRLSTVDDLVVNRWFHSSVGLKYECPDMPCMETV